MARSALLVMALVAAVAVVAVAAQSVPSHGVAVPSPPLRQAAHRARVLLAATADPSAVAAVFDRPPSATASSSSADSDDDDADGPTDAACAVCEGVVATLDALLRQNATRDAIERVAVDVCVALRLPNISPAVCALVVPEYAAEVLAIVAARAQPLTLCVALRFCNGTDPSPTPAPTQPGLSLEQILALPCTPPPPSPVPPQDLGTFVHISDVHYDAQYTAGTNTQCGEPLCCRAANGPGVYPNVSGPFGDYACDVPLATVASAFASIGALAAGEQAPDFVLWTGDDPPHDVWNQSRAANAAAVRDVSALLRAALPAGTRVFPALGNHETYPVNQFAGVVEAGADAWLYDALADAWAGWLDAPALADLRRGGYYTMLARPGLRVVVLNTELGSPDNWWLLETDTNALARLDPLGQLAWLAATLEQARRAGERVYVTGHRAPDALYESYALALHGLLDTYRATVAALFFGHTHTDSYVVVRDVATSTTPLLVGYVAPSLTTYTNVNPSYRVVAYDRASAAVVDYTTYRVDLPRANAPGGELVWAPAYTFRAAYDVPDLSAAALQHLVTRLALDDALLARWYANYRSGVTGPAIQPCTSVKCRRTQLCALSSATPDLAAQCAGQAFRDAHPDWRDNTNC